MEEKPSFKKIVLGAVAGTVILGGIIYAGYSYSQKSAGKLTLPAGQNYLGSEAPSFGGLANPPTAPQRFTAAADVAWKEFKGKSHPFSFSYPETLNLGIFPNDPNDSIAIIWGNILPQSNILLNIETISARYPEFVGNTEQYVQNWWKAFSGLKGVRSVDKFTNTNGLVGYKAVYINKSDQTPNIDVFLEIPGDSDKLIHLANGVLDPVIFNRLVDSIKYSSPAAAASPTPNL